VEETLDALRKTSATVIDKFGCGVMLFCYIPFDEALQAKRFAAHINLALTRERVRLMQWQADDAKKSPLVDTGDWMITTGLKKETGAALSRETFTDNPTSGISENTE